MVWRRASVQSTCARPSATLMFVLERILLAPDGRGPGMAMAFGLGLSVESFAFLRP
jgi:predicted naringenin-chalcone synthase